MKNNINMKNIARRITIEVDDKGVQLITAVDLMIPVAGGRYIHLPAPRVTDSRLLCLQLLNVVTTYMQGIFAALAPMVQGNQEPEEGSDNGATKPQ